MKLLLRLLVNSGALVITDWLLTGIQIKDLKTALIASIVLGFINAIIRPILLLLTAPINLLTLGLFTFIINATTLSLTSWLLGGNFWIENFGWAVIAAFVLSIVSMVLSWFIKDITK